MPAALRLEIRHEIVERRQRGESFRAIAETMQLAYDTVRGIWQHWQRHGTLQPNYGACSHPGPRKKRAVYEAAIAMKSTHRRWGAQVIRLKLQEQFEEDDLPSVRTLQVWFRQAGVNRGARATRTKTPTVTRGQAVHEVWAVDAKERIKLGDGSRASWLTITDEASGAILHAEVFPPEVLDASGTNPGAPDHATPVPGMGEAPEDAL